MERRAFIVNPDLSLNVTNLAAFLRLLPPLEGATDRYIGNARAGTYCLLVYRAPGKAPVLAPCWAVGTDKQAQGCAGEGLAPLDRARPSPVLSCACGI